MSDSTAQDQESSVRYVFDRPLGQGGTARIFLARDTQLGRHVAIKRLREDVSIDANLRKEAGILAALQHPNIVTLFDLDVDFHGVFAVMEYVNGHTLLEIAEGHPMDVHAFIEMGDQICRGIAAAHSRGLTHQDLKPANIMLHYHEDQSFTVKVLDFGLARHSAERVTEEDEIFGTIDTIAPERLERNPADVRSDIYSLGCVFYFALLGYYPYSGTQDEILTARMLKSAPPVHLYRPEIPIEISELIQKMMAIDPDVRPQSADEVRKRLLLAANADAGHGNSGKISSSSIIPPPNPATRQTADLGQKEKVEKPSFAGIAAVIGSVLALLAAGGGFYLMRSRTSAPTQRASIPPSSQLVQQEAEVAPVQTPAPKAAPPKSKPKRPAKVSSPIPVSSGAGSQEDSLLLRARFDDTLGCNLINGATLGAPGSGVSGEPNDRCYVADATSWNKSQPGPAAVISNDGQIGEGLDEITFVVWYKSSAEIENRIELISAYGTRVIWEAAAKQWNVNMQVRNSKNKPYSFFSGVNPQLSSWETPGKWLFFAFVWKRDGNKMAFYQGSPSDPVQLYKEYFSRVEQPEKLTETVNSERVIGNNRSKGKSQPFIGCIDDVQIFSSALDLDALEKLRKHDLKPSAAKTARP